MAGGVYYQTLKTRNDYVKLYELGWALLEKKTTIMKAKDEHGSLNVTNGFSDLDAIRVPLGDNNLNLSLKTVDVQDYGK